MSIFRKFVEKIQYLLKSDRNNRYFTWKRMYIYVTLWISSYYKCFGQML